jgi:hypothetical protein
VSSPVTQSGKRRYRADSRALRVAVAFAFPILTLACAHAFFDPAYRTNDDPGMLLFSAGAAFSERPSAYLIFSNHAWGALVAFFYNLFPGVPWYRLLQLAVQVGANATLVYVALGRRISASRLLPIAGYFAVFDMLMSARPHFTLTASIAGVAAVVLSWDRSPDRDRLGPARWTLFVVLWSASAAIRHESAVLVFLLSAPAAIVPLLHAWRGEDGGRAARRVVAPLLVAAAVIASLHAYHHVRYGVSDWRDYRETEPGIISVLDFSASGLGRTQTWQRFPDGTVRLEDVRYAPQIYAAAAEGPGWTKNQLHMLMEYFYADTELFTSERFAKFLDRVGKPPPAAPEPFKPLRTDPNLYLFLVAIALGVSSRKLDSRAAIQGALTALTALALISYVDLELNRLLPWVYEPIFAFLGWSILTLGRERPLVIADRTWFLVRAVAIGILLSLLPPAANRIAGESAITASRSAAFEESVRRLDASPERLYVAWAESFPLELLRPFDRLEPYRALDCYGVGGETRSGHNRRQLRRFGITDIHRAIYEDPRVLVISQPRQNRVLEGFVRERYGTQITAERIESFTTKTGPLFEVYRFSAVPTIE